MNWKTWSLLILALIAGSAAAYGIKAIFFVEHAPATTGETSVAGLKEQLLVAKGDLSAGTELSALNVRLTLTPEDEVPRDGIFSFNGVSGRKVSRDLKDGEPISLYDLEESEQSEGASVGFVPPECSIVPIEISSATKENGNRNYLKTTKLNKMIKTGDSVDVFVVKEVPSKSEPVALPRLATETVAMNVSVFAVADESRFSSDGVVRTSTISTLLTSDQLEKVREASEEGKIRIVLHSEADVDGEGQPSSIFEPADNSPAGAYRLPFEQPRGVVPVRSADASDADAQSFVIGLNTGDSDVADERNAPGATFLPQTNAPTGDAFNNVVPADGLINNDFTIGLGELETDEDGEADSGQNNSIAADRNDSVRWNSVDFNSPRNEVVEEQSSLQNSNWLGPRSFRAREAVDEELKGAAIPYERAASERVTSEPSVVEEEVFPEIQLPDVQKEVSVETSHVTDVPNPSGSKSVKKYSPFVTVSSGKPRK